jgi:hypothetical protein
VFSSENLECDEEIQRRTEQRRSLKTYTFGEVVGNKNGPQYKI